MAAEASVVPAVLGNQGVAFLKELKKISWIALPMVVVTISQHLLRVASMMMVGHLGTLPLSGASIATSLTSVTGFNLVFGMAGALETLCGQAYGAGLHRKLGIYLSAAIISLILTCIPISILWVFMDKLLVFIHQDHMIAAEAGKYSVALISSLFPYAILQAQIRYLQTQSLIIPMLISSVAALCFHLPVCWALVFHTKLGISGAALSIGLSYWLNVLLLFLYVKYSTACRSTRIALSRDVLPSTREFWKFAVPSAVMCCLEGWIFEVVILISGFLPNPQLEASVLSICLSISSLFYYVPYSIGAAASTRVSNELGSGNAEGARIAVLAAVTLTMAEMIIGTSILFSCRHVIGYAFSQENDVIIYLGKMIPFLCLMVAMDCIQGVLSGVARGSGWQHIGAYVNLGAYYLVGFPAAIVLGFPVHLRGQGLWIGLNAGSVVQSTLYSVITCFTNWNKEAVEAQKRMSGRNESENVSSSDLADTSTVPLLDSIGLDG